MSSINIIMQGKGGVGKTLVSSLLSQYLASKEKEISCYDVDPVNSSFIQYEALNVTQIQLLKENKNSDESLDEIDPRKFDTLMEAIFATDRDIVIDSGASSFLPLTQYMKANAVAQMIADTGHQLIIHTIIVGGQGLSDTLNGSKHLLNMFPENDVAFCFWLNPFFGPVEVEGKRFYETKVYKEHISKRKGAVIVLPSIQSQMFKDDYETLLTNHQTFTEALSDNSYPIMMRQRLKILQRDLFMQIAECSILD